MTPGAYIKLRRCAGGLSIADVAARIATTPRLAEHARVELLELIEADAQPASFETIVVLRHIFDFDIGVLGQLVAISLGAEYPMPQICRICGCSDADPCVDAWHAGCCWGEPDLCSACAPAESAAA